MKTMKKTRQTARVEEFCRFDRALKSHYRPWRLIKQNFCVHAVKWHNNIHCKSVLDSLFIFFFFFRFALLHSVINKRAIKLNAHGDTEAIIDENEMRIHDKRT